MDPQCCHAKGYFWSLVYMYLLLRKGAGSIIILQKEKTIHIIKFMWLLCYYTHYIETQGKGKT